MKQLPWNETICTKINLFSMHLLSFIMLNKYVSIGALSYITIYPLSIYSDLGKESGYQLPKKGGLGLGRNFPLPTDIPIPSSYIYFHNALWFCPPALPDSSHHSLSFSYILWNPYFMITNSPICSIASLNISYIFCLNWNQRTHFVCSRSRMSDDLLCVLEIER